MSSSLSRLVVTRPSALRKGLNGNTEAEKVTCIESDRFVCLTIGKGLVLCLQNQHSWYPKDLCLQGMQPTGLHQSNLHPTSQPLQGLRLKSMSLDNQPPVNPVLDYFLLL